MRNVYFGIGVYNIEFECNIGTLLRSAQNFGAAFIFVIGKRYKRQKSDTTNATNQLPFYDYIDFNDFFVHIPKNCLLIGVEQCSKSKNVKDFIHPQRCIYLLGAEDSGLPTVILDKCAFIVNIDTPMCLNVATAGSIIMYDRKNKLSASP